MWIRLFNAHFREYFNSNRCLPFKFTADMATAWEKSKENMIWAFTTKICLKFIMEIQIRPSMTIRFGQWNQFLKGFQ